MGSIGFIGFIGFIGRIGLIAPILGFRVFMLGLISPITPPKNCQGCIYISYCVCLFSFRSTPRTFTPSSLRLLLASILKAKRGRFLISFGMVCSTFVAISRHSTQREYFNPCGNTDSKCVEESNILCSRTTCVGFVDMLHSALCHWDMFLAGWRSPFI